ncbi:PREDICTED: uncharacterized protein LOC109206467 [Nicotiana attenuata]|uniref:uncharacterized protein LOC109206467 n=1 Tax=Nicotiana attenuata TaxID=49451 RepID=UPI0009059546|nr:PREDICTED: uncharacterized protein LOC109206467 [Nicotiana attenuata]
MEGQYMWLQKWSPDFKPEEDLPIAPVWVLLPGLPFHMHTWQYVKQVVGVVGTPLEMDLATRGRTRPSVAKVRVEIDLLKPQPDSVYVGQVYENAPQKGFVQKLEYDGIPKCCKYCRKLGHNLLNCRAIERKKAAEDKEAEIRRNKKATEANLTTINENGKAQGIMDDNRYIGTEQKPKLMQNDATKQVTEKEATKQVDEKEKFQQNGILQNSMAIQQNEQADGINDIKTRTSKKKRKISKKKTPPKEIQSVI